MKEYIEKDIAIKKVSAVSWAASRINSIPAADVVEVRHGQWSRIDYETCGYDYLCSACKQKNDWETHYCPNCGAKMDGGINNG